MRGRLPATDAATKRCCGPRLCRQRPGPEGPAPRAVAAGRGGRCRGCSWGDGWCAGAPAGRPGRWATLVRGAPAECALHRPPTCPGHRSRLSAGGPARGPSRHDASDADGGRCMWWPIGDDDGARWRKAAEPCGTGDGTGGSHRVIAPDDRTGGSRRGIAPGDDSRGWHRRGWRRLRAHCRARLGGAMWRCTGALFSGRYTVARHWDASLWRVIGTRHRDASPGRFTGARHRGASPPALGPAAAGRRNGAASRGASLCRAR
jgi:hypothetical protein